MAITVTPNLIDVSMCESVTGWSDTIEQMVVQNATYLQGDYALGAWVDATLSTTEYYAISTVNMSGNGYHVYMWMNCSGVVDTQANGGYRIVLYSGTGSDYATFYVGGNDTHGTGWQLMCVDPAATPDLETGTFDPTDVVRIGLAFKTLTAAVKQGQVYMYNCFWDAVRYGTGLTITSGDTDGITPDDIYQIDNSSLLKYGAVQKSYGSYIFTGMFILGNTGTSAIDFIIDNEIIIFPDNDYVATDFYGIKPVGNATGNTYIDIKNSVIKAAGSRKFSFDISDSNIDTFSMIGSTLNNAGLSTFQSGLTVTGNVFNACLQVDPSTSTFNNNKFTNSVATDGSVLWPTDDTNISDLQFEICDNDIEYDAASDSTTPTFVNIIHDDTASDYDVNNTSGGAISIALNGTSNANSYTGSAVTFTSAAVTVQATITDASGTLIENVLTYLQADAKSSGTATTNTTDKLVDTGATFEADGVAIGDTAYNKDDGTSALVTAVDSETSLSFGSDLFPDGNEDYRVGGPFPDNDPVTIVNSGTTATVTHPIHDMLSNDYVYVTGGSLDANRGVFQITYIGANSYSYTMASTPGSSPTGTITSTFVGLYGLTNASGVKSTSRVYDSDQLLTGWARKSSSSPFYQEAPMRGTVDSSTGLLATGVLVADE